jgi:hypothetical protein
MRCVDAGPEPTWVGAAPAARADAGGVRREEREGAEPGSTGTLTS